MVLKCFFYGGVKLCFTGSHTEYGWVLFISVSGAMCAFSAFTTTCWA